MKKLETYLLYFIISIFLLGSVGIYFLQKSISSKLESKNKDVINSWKIFNDKLAERDLLLSSLSLAKSDSLICLMNKSRSVRINKNNSSDVVISEYQLNKFMMKRFPEPDKSILDLINSLNTLSINYNSVAKDYNVYFSTFPNFLIAKKNKLKRAFYFDIEYGKENEDPVKKSKELPEWAKNVDTI